MGQSNFLIGGVLIVAATEVVTEVVTPRLEVEDSRLSTGGTSSSGGASSAGGVSPAGGTLASGGTISSGGVSPAGGTAGHAGLGGFAGATHCPGTAGPIMVALPLGYCIDSTEVTRAQYKAWLDTSPSTSGQIAECSWNTNYTPTSDWPPTDKLNYPVVYVNWCDAYAYCKAVGKRLCGKIGGGANDYRDFNDATKSQWFSACSSGGTNRYPYGNEFNPTTCNSREAGYLSPLAVKFLTNCQPSAPYAGVYDLSGNIAEWEDSCEGDLKHQYCHLRGGAYCPHLNLKQDSCGRVPYGSNRNNSDPHYGFRCCS
jgi:formylglycine-generating enzyme